MVLSIFSLYTHDKTLSERFLRQNGLKEVFSHLGINNMYNRKLAAVITLNCIKNIL
jgi:hypothetical protein